MNNTIDFNTAKTIDTMSKKIDHIDDTVSGFFSFMHMVMQELRLMQCYLMPDETALRELSEGVIEKLKLMSDADFAEVEFPLN